MQKKISDYYNCCNWLSTISLKEKKQRNWILKYQLFWFLLYNVQHYPYRPNVLWFNLQIIWLQQIDYCFCFLLLPLLLLKVLLATFGNTIYYQIDQWINQSFFFFWTLINSSSDINLFAQSKKKKKTRVLIQSTNNLLLLFNVFFPFSPPLLPSPPPPPFLRLFKKESYNSIVIYLFINDYWNNNNKNNDNNNNSDNLVVR